MDRAFLSLLLFLSGSCAVLAQERIPEWISAGPYVEDPEFFLELPLETLATKLYVDVEINGVPKKFVFDTGSPSMISKALAAELGLDAIDSRQGVDAHGVIIQSDIVQADLTLGGVNFRKVPIFAADFSTSKAAQCLVGDGVLGSEILPLCAWQIDLPDSMLRCSSRARELDHVRGAKKQRLHDFGYPHAPILDVRFEKKASSKAMFDTGSPGYFVISPPDFEGASRAGGIGRTIPGYGSLGGSLGGQAPDGQQLKGELHSLSIGNIKLGRVSASVRERPPSLVGASILEHFVVTFDSKSETAYFDQYREGPFVRSSFGFSLAFGEPISVALVWEESPAAEAGLRAGQAITAINGEATDSSCEGMRRALQAMQEDTVRIEIEGQLITLTRYNTR